MRLAEHFIFFFRNEFNKLNNTGARMLDYIHHMIFKLLKNRIVAVVTYRFCPLLRNVKIDVIT